MLQGCALGEPGGPRRLTLVLDGQLENLVSFFIEIIFWAPWISQVQSTGLPLIFVRAQPCVKATESVKQESSVKKDYSFEIRY